MIKEHKHDNLNLPKKERLKKEITTFINKLDEEWIILDNLNRVEIATLFYKFFCYIKYIEDENKELKRENNRIKKDSESLRKHLSRMETEINRWEDI